MPKKRHSDDIPSELPPYNGPKLRRFKDHDCDIEWGERIGDNGETPAQGYVFRATIKHREYAVKVFKFYDPMSDEHFWGPLIGEDTPLDVAAYLGDPFYAECRAYGRIQESQRKRPRADKAAVPCHGFFFLKEKDYQYLSEENIDMDLGLDEVSESYQRSAIGGFSPRAIVKDLASSEPGVSEKTLPKVLRNIVALNRYQIYNMDIRLDNFRDSKLIDFGSSWTEPHPLMNAQKPGAVSSSKTADRVMFDQMVKDEEIPNPRNVSAVHTMSLRRRRT